jgi:hypothetical protein
VRNVNKSLEAVLRFGRVKSITGETVTLVAVNRPTGKIATIVFQSIDLVRNY